MVCTLGITTLNQQRRCPQLQVADVLPTNATAFFKLYKCRMLCDMSGLFHAVPPLQHKCVNATLPHMSLSLKCCSSCLYAPCSGTCQACLAQCRCSTTMSMCFKSICM
jgi:hypothetical protein